MAWQKSNDYGYTIERSTISRNGIAVVPIERVQLTTAPITPKPLAEWEALATQDQNAAILAQALYGDNFNVSTSSDKSTLGKITAINDKLEQRFTFALLAAEQNYEAAKLAAMAYDDNTVKKGEKYVYRVHVVLPTEEILKIEDATIFAGPDLYEELPKPIGFFGIFGDSDVMLSWDFSILKSVYTNYYVERSINGTDFTKLNGLPIFNAEQEKEDTALSLYYKGLHSQQ